MEKLTKTILKLYPNVKQRALNVRSSQEAFKTDLKYFEDKHKDKVRFDKTQLIIQIPGYTIHYRGNVQVSPHIIQGFRADVVEIFENCVDQDFINEVIAPMRCEVIFID